LPNLNLFQGLFHYIDAVIIALKRIEDWLDLNCQKNESDTTQWEWKHNGFYF